MRRGEESRGEEKDKERQASKQDAGKEMCRQARKQAEIQDAQ